MGFSVDYNNVGNAPVKPGEYEVYPSEFEIKRSQNTGNQMVVMNYLIRDDVDQPSQGSEIKFDNFVYTPNSYWRFNQAAKAAGVPDGTTFNGPEDWAKAMINRALRVDVGQRTYNGNIYPQVKGFKSSLVSQGKLTVGTSSINDDPFANSSEPINISDDDLPF